jgi:hypothetical protein
VNDDNWLTGVSVVSACDAWAVGGYRDSEGGGGLIEHWTGSSWVAQLVPGIEQLNAVTALSRSDAWAVGSSFPPGQIDHALALHWNGMAWRAVPVPNAGRTASSELYGVSATSARDIWAVGGYQSGRGEYRDLIEHWNGRTWRRVQGPRRPAVADQILSSVTAVTPTMVWATGEQNDGSDAYGAALIRWDGIRWHKVQLPLAARAGTLGLDQVAASSPRDAWAVGWSDRFVAKGNKMVSKPVAMHWNGRKWNQVRLPGPAYAGLSGVAVISPSNVWVTGGYGRSILLQRVLIGHWDGRSWKIVRGPDPGSPQAEPELAFMAGTTPADMWAVGQYGYKATHSLITHCCRWHVLALKGPSAGSGQ